MRYSYQLSLLTNVEFECTYGHVMTLYVSYEGRGSRGDGNAVHALISYSVIPLRSIEDYTTSSYCHIFFVFVVFLEPFITIS